jgi:hypothetical protein
MPSRCHRSGVARLSGEDILLSTLVSSICRSRPHLLARGAGVFPDHRHRGMTAEGGDFVIGASGPGQLLDAAIPQRVEVVIEKAKARALLAHDAGRLEVAEGPAVIIRKDRDPGARRCVEGPLQLMRCRAARD